MTTGRINQVTN